MLDFVYLQLKPFPRVPSGDCKDTNHQLLSRNLASHAYIPPLGVCWLKVDVLTSHPENVDGT